MGTDAQNAYLRGILRPDTRTTWWDTESGEYNGGTRITGIQSASPEAGIPAPGRATSMGLRAAGPQTAGLSIQCTRGGLPDVDEVGLQWSDTGASGTWRGNDLPNVIWRYEWLQAGTYASPHLLSTPDGTAILCYYNSANTRIETRTRSATAHTWAAAVTVVSAGADPHPCLVRLPTGRVHLYGWRQVTATQHQVQLWYSDDNGATWISGGDVLSGPLDTSVYVAQLRLRGGYLAGQVLLTAHVRVDGSTGAGVYLDAIYQWSSSDGGMLFSAVTVQTNTAESHGAQQEVLVDGAVFLVGWCYYNTTDQDVAVKWVRLASASDSITAALAWGDTNDTDTGRTLGVRTAGVGSGGNDYRLDYCELAAEVDDDGAICMFVRHEDTGECPVLRSQDGGQVWRGTGTSARFTSLGQCWYDTGAVNEWADDFVCCRLHGRVLLVTSWYTGAAATGDLMALYLGGWQTVTMPQRAGSLAPFFRVAWERTWVGVKQPAIGAGSPWTDTTVAGGTISAPASGAVTYTAAAAADRAYSTANPATTLTQGLMAEWALTWTSGVLHHTLLITDGAGNVYSTTLRFNGATVDLWDDYLGAAIASTAWTGGAAVRLRMALVQVSGAGWVRAWVCADSGTTEDRVWTAAGNSSAVTNGAAVVANDVVRFGSATGAGTAVGVYRECHYTHGAYTGDQWVQTQESRLQYPRAITDEGTYFQYQVALSAINGPAIPGDTWTVTPTAEYPYTNLLPTAVPSPRHVWRSRAVGAMGLATNLRLSWTISPNHATSEGGMSDLWGFYLDGVNFGAPAVYLYYGGAWNLVATGITDTFDARRDGSSFYVNTGGAVSGGYTWRRGELDGAGYETGNAGGFGVSQYRGTIDTSYPGTTRVTSASLTYKMISSDAAGAMGATCTVRLWPRRHLFLVRLSAFSEYVRGFQIRIPVNGVGVGVTSPGAPKSLYYELGKVVAGPVWAWGSSYSWGRSITYDPAQDIVEADDGTRIVRVRGPIRRGVEISWADGTDTTNPVTSNLPDYTTAAASGKPVAFLRDTPLDIVDEVRQLQGAGTPVVYLPYIPRGGTGGPHRWAQGAVYGRIADAVAIESAQGEEEATEVLRVARLTISEEV